MISIYNFFVLCTHYFHLNCRIKGGYALLERDKTLNDKSLNFNWVLEPVLISFFAMRLILNFEGLKLLSPQFEQSCFHFSISLEFG